MRPHTLGERRRLYLLARLVVKRHYSEPLTLQVVAKALSSSPRQLQRAYAQFGSGTFRADLFTRRMVAAAGLLSDPTIRVRDVARLVGYHQPSYFAHAFRGRYGVSPAAFRAKTPPARQWGDDNCCSPPTALSPPQPVEEAPTWV
jgi:AraC family transcriptional regulator of adaptative response / methylphosphotriester-DNA alkyltransferase methyltransferase